ncbi:F0F1 ATP synthase subunit epsilon [Taurinivorans muris]|uniref:ATP synthase epsilon chain n=1 Tax=Taurinivorans muris TaxID=2787751 RepID=A0ABY5Y4F3_9BACT|nr:F0F1 ATP synthase subunit epsilon [Desulfovibrionaceae bacterium LT0009]
MMAALRLEIVTPDQVVLSSDVEYVGAPGVDGEFGVLAGHIPLLTALSIGTLVYRIGNKDYMAFIAGGFAEVADNKITILAQAAELAENIDVERAEKAKARAEERLQNAKHQDGIDIVRAENAMKRAIMRLKIANNK